MRVLHQHRDETVDSWRGHVAQKVVREHCNTVGGSPLAFWDGVQHDPCERGQNEASEEEEKPNEQDEDCYVTDEGQRKNNTSFKQADV